eukprot:3309579-Prymnesium_polylepis.2
MDVSALRRMRMTIRHVAGSPPSRRVKSSETVLCFTPVARSSPLPISLPISSPKRTVLAQNGPKHHGRPLATGRKYFLATFTLCCVSSASDAERTPSLGVHDRRGDTRAPPCRRSAGCRHIPIASPDLWATPMYSQCTGRVPHSIPERIGGRLASSAGPSVRARATASDPEGQALGNAGSRETTRRRASRVGLPLRRGAHR